MAYMLFLFFTLQGCALGRIEGIPVLWTCEMIFMKKLKFSSQSRVIGVTGLEVTAGQRTMSGLIGELTSQLFVLPVMLTGHNRSYWKWNQLFQLLSVCSESLCIAKRWSEILGEIQLQPLFTIRALKQTLGFTRFRSQNLKYFYFYELSNNLRASDRSRRKKSSFAGFLERFAEKSADIAGISRKFSGLTMPKNNR